MTPTPALSPADIDPDLWCLFDPYVHGNTDRRGFLDRAARFAAASGTTAAALLAALSPDFARAQKAAPADARLTTEWVEFASPAGHGKLRAYVARPARAAGPLPVVLVVHDIARAMAVLCAWIGHLLARCSDTPEKLSASETLGASCTGATHASPRQPHRATDGAPVRREPQRPEQTTLYRLVHQHAPTGFAEG